jgi:hypothetical protein
MIVGNAEVSMQFIIKSSEIEKASTVAPSGFYRFETNTDAAWYIHFFQKKIIHIYKHQLKSCRFTHDAFVVYGSITV